MSKSAILLVAASFICATMTVSTANLAADDIYVSTSASASNDNPGTSAWPLSTIAEAISRSQPGDTVVVVGGNYQTEDSGFGTGVIPVISKIGTATNPIRVTGLNSPSVGSFLVHNCRHVQVSGFQVIGSDYFADVNWQSMPTIVRDIPADPDAPIDFTRPYSERQIQIEAAFATYFSVVEDLNFSSGIDVMASSFIRVEDNEVTGFWAGIQCRGASDVVIRNNTIRHTINGIFTWVPAPGLTNGLIINNDISQSLDTGIFVRQESENVSVINNRVQFTGRNHIAINEGSHNCLVRRNNVRFGGYYTETMQFPGSSAISLNDAGASNRVIDNSASFQTDLTGIDGNGIILDLSRPEACTAVFGNWSFLNMGSGMNLTNSPNSKIVSNFFVNNGFNSTARRNGAGIKLSRTGDINNYIVNNLFFRNRDAGILSEDTLAEQAIVDDNFYVTPAGVPLAWDSFFDGVSTYETLEELQMATDWELNGTALIVD